MKPNKDRIVKFINHLTQDGISLDEFLEQWYTHPAGLELCMGSEPIAFVQDIDAPAPTDDLLSESRRTVHIIRYTDDLQHKRYALSLPTSCVLEFDNDDLEGELAYRVYAYSTGGRDRVFIASLLLSVRVFDGELKPVQRD